VIQSRGQLGLVDEHLGEDRIVRQVGQDALDDKDALEACWPCTRALNTSAIPPRPMRSNSVYLPNEIG